MKITLNELKQLVKNVINEEMGKMKMEGEEMSKEEKAMDVLQDILKPSEIEFLKKQYKMLGKSGLKDEVNSVIELSEMVEADELSEDEFKLRNIINKIIKKGTVLSALGVVPAAMFVGGSAALGLGIASLAGMLLKDAAFWKKDGKIHRKGLEKSDAEMEA
jgi:hypothetical protein